MFNVGVCFVNGTGTQTSYENARKWFEKAREFGHEDAQEAIDALDELEKTIKDKVVS